MEFEDAEAGVIPDIEAGVEIIKLLQEPGCVAKQ